MAEKGIIFSAPMVQALLGGRKTQTRRILKPQPGDTLAAGKRVDHVGDYCTGAPQHGQAYYWRANGSWNSSERFHLPYASGDRLYVRESALYWIRRSDNQRDKVAAFKADGYELGDGERWTPSIHMPRHFSRIWLAVTEVRVQRLKECSEADAIAEGIEGFACTGGTAWRDYVGGMGSMFATLATRLRAATLPSGTASTPSRASGGRTIHGS
ncbi:hypothetical protein GR702_01280 [Novosphingobium sp. FGD1]|uniref:Uncharacterized protein n=1 Tax=Novosphingobium silvae TaxID=2692619 RepID=A0A7X4GEQ9_9SPHN|nr:hypothetical protein [Novosphingobium silvae]MYL96407.1 hypothetical protein [Novosphingobium silvae]